MLDPNTHCTGTVRTDSGYQLLIYIIFVIFSSLLQFSFPLSVLLMLTVVLVAACCGGSGVDGGGGSGGSGGGGGGGSC